MVKMVIAMIIHLSIFFLMYMTRAVARVDDLVGLYHLYVVQYLLLHPM